MPLGFEMPKDKYLTCALYKFATLSKYQEMREPLRKKMKSCNVFGTILLANEGINGTISGNSEDVISVIDWLEDNEDIGKLEIKRSYSDEIPFYFHTALWFIAVVNALFLTTEWLWIMT